MADESLILDGQDYPPISDYGLISDMHSCALVSRSGSIDWCCFPRFDSPAVFARLLDSTRGGSFVLAPEDIRSTSRRYLPGTNVLETTFETKTGVAKLFDCMPVHPSSRPEQPESVTPRRQIVRVLRCESGTVRVKLSCEPRFEYGSIVPHAHQLDRHNGYAHGGANAVELYSTLLLTQTEGGFEAEGELRAGQEACTSLTGSSLFTHEPEVLDSPKLWRRLHETVDFWERWSSQCTYKGPYAEEVLRSALTLKAMSYAPSGALLAAATTSLPEWIGGTRNWDYRFTWIRDASFAVYALSTIGFRAEAERFEDWLEWSTTGRASDLQTMYGIAGERRLTEIELDHLSGYRNSRPVRIGNDAYRQLQIDMYGQLLDAAHLYRRHGGTIDERSWEFLRDVVQFVVEHWREPDNGIWESRGQLEHFVFSKVWCWVALDRAVKAVEQAKLAGDLELWRRVRAEIREEVLERGYDPDRGAFVQSYGSHRLDASVLMFPLVGFIKATDPRMRSTIAAIERELTTPEGFVYRYRDYDDGIPGRDEGAFLICTLWLVDNLILTGEVKRARALLDKVGACANDLGLLSEEVEPGSGMLLGNFPQAFSHLGLINAAVQLEKAEAEARQ